MMMGDPQKINVSLSQDEALVLYDWLSRFNEASSKGLDEVQGRILDNLESELERLLEELFATDFQQWID